MTHVPCLAPYSSQLLLNKDKGGSAGRSGCLTGSFGCQDCLSWAESPLFSCFPQSEHASRGPRDLQLCLLREDMAPQHLSPGCPCLLLCCWRTVSLSSWEKEAKNKTKTQNKISGGGNGQTSGLQVAFSLFGGRYCVQELFDSKRLCCVHFFFGVGKAYCEPEGHKAVSYSVILPKFLVPFRTNLKYFE